MLYTISKGQTQLLLLTNYSRYPTRTEAEKYPQVPHWPRCHFSPGTTHFDTAGNAFSRFKQHTTLDQYPTLTNIAYLNMLSTAGKSIKTAVTSYKGWERGDIPSKQLASPPKE